jgi:chromosomal replication initiator protein
MRIEALKSKLKEYEIHTDQQQLVQWSQQLDNQTFRDLESFVTKIYFQTISGTHVTQKQSRPNVKSIIHCVANWFQISDSDILSSSRKTEIALPRHVAMYLALKYSGLNKSAIARAFKRSDHSTVIHADKKIRSLIQKDPEFARTIQNIEQQTSPSSDETAS